MVFTPFLDKQFMRFAKSLKVDTKVGLRNGKKWGKFILRECFESDLGANIAWRRKYAQEEGSGFTTVRNILLQGCKSDALADGESGRDSGVRIRDMEQLYYFISIESIFLHQLKRLVPVKDALIAVLVLVIIRIIVTPADVSLRRDY